MLSGPEITGAGVGMMVMLLLTALSQPKAEVWFTETEPVPAAPHNTLMLLPVLLPQAEPSAAARLGIASVYYGVQQEQESYL